MRIRNLLMTSLFLLAACARSGGDSNAEAADFGAPGTKESRDAIYAHLQEFGSVGINANRDETHYPGHVLKHLHTYLSERRGLKRTRIDGREALLLRRPPASVMRQIQAVAFPDSFRSGFEVLQASFWSSLGRAMDEGLTVGFLEPDPNFNVSGVYYEGYNYGRGLLLLDIFAGQGTFVHEYQHHVQAGRRKAREYRRSWFDRGATELGSACLAQTSRFLGELNATTVELPSWIGVFQTLDITPAWHQTAARGDKDPVRFPQAYMLVTNLDYPGRAATGLEGQACPEELVSAVARIKASTDDFSANLVENYTGKLFKLRMEHFHASVAVNSGCTAPALCEQKRARLALIPAEAAAIKAKVDELLTKEAAERPARIREAFSALPAPLQADLCEYASAYELLVDCKPFDAKRKEDRQ